MWAQLINVAVGLWLMAAPEVLSYGGAAKTSDHIAGPLIATFATIALWQVTRALRWANLPLSLWLLAAPWFLFREPRAVASSVACGLLLGALSLVRGRITRRTGGGWSALRWGRRGEPSAS